MDVSEIISFIRTTFSEPEKAIILHDPRFCGNERRYLLDAMDSNFVSSAGEYVGRFEKSIAEYTGSPFAVAAVNGTKYYMSNPGGDAIGFYTKEIAPYKGALELWYLTYKNLWIDLKIIFLTAWVIIFPKSSLPFECFRDLPKKPTWMEE